MIIPTLQSKFVNNSKYLKTQSIQSTGEVDHSPNTQVPSDKFHLSMSIHHNVHTSNFSNLKNILISEDATTVHPMGEVHPSPTTQVPSDKFHLSMSIHPNVEHCPYTKSLKFENILISKTLQRSSPMGEVHPSPNTQYPSDKSISQCPYIVHTSQVPKFERSTNARINYRYKLRRGTLTYTHPLSYTPLSYLRSMASDFE